MPGAPVVIVGGGMSGLAAAYELGRRDVPFLLLEAAPSLGGVVKTERIDGFLIDASYRLTTFDFSRASASSSRTLVAFG